MDLPMVMVSMPFLASLSVTTGTGTAGVTLISFLQDTANMIKRANAPVSNFVILVSNKTLTIPLSNSFDPKCSIY